MKIDEKAIQSNQFLKRLYSDGYVAGKKLRFNSQTIEDGMLDEHSEVFLKSISPKTKLIKLSLRAENQETRVFEVSEEVLRANFVLEEPLSDDAELTESPNSFIEVPGGFVIKQWHPGKEDSFLIRLAELGFKPKAKILYKSSEDEIDRKVQECFEGTIQKVLPRDKKVVIKTRLNLPSQKRKEWKISFLTIEDFDLLYTIAKQ